MPYLNLNAVPHELLPAVLSSFSAITFPQAQKIAAAIESHGAFASRHEFDKVLAASGVAERAVKDLTQWLSVDRQECFRKVNLYNIGEEELQEILPALRGFSRKQAAALVECLFHEPRPESVDEFWQLLGELGIGKRSLTVFGQWLTVAPDRSNAFSCYEFKKELEDLILIHEVIPRNPGCGDLLRISGQGFGLDRGQVEVVIGGHSAKIVDLHPETGLIEAEVPWAAKDSCELYVNAGGMGCLYPVEIEIAPSLELRDCPSGADAEVVVHGTMHPALIEVQRESLAMPQENFFLESSYRCGLNSCHLPRGNSHLPYAVNQVSLVGVNSPLIYGLSAFMPVLANIVTIQLVGTKEKDPATGKEEIVYYFFRNGKWWKVLDPEKKHPDDPNGIDLRETGDPNFREATPQEAGDLDRRFFPTGWERMWDGMSQQEMVQFQIMFAMAWQMNGLSAEDLEVLLDIKKRRHAGESWESIFNRHWKYIAGVLLLSAGAGAAFKVLGRLFGPLFRKLLIKRMTQVTKSADEIEITIRSGFRPKNGKGGVYGKIKGRVERGNGRLECDPSMEEWVNSTGKSKLATDTFLDWIEIMKKFAKEKGLGQVRVTRVASTPDGAAMMRRLGFEPVSGRCNADGIGMWRKVYEVD